MGKILGMVRRHAIISAAGGAVLLAGAGVGTAAVVSNPPTDEVSNETPVDVEPVTTEPTATTEPATTTTPAEPADAVAPEPATDTAESPAVDTPADTVEDVPQPEETPDPTPTAPPGKPTPYDPEASWVDSTGRTYIPAPVVPVEPLPGEGVEEPGD